MFTINAYIALTALGCITFLGMAVRGYRRDTVSRVQNPLTQLGKAA